MYIFLTIVSSMLTYIFLLKYEKKLCFKRDTFNLLIISYFLTTTINLCIIYLISGNIDLSLISITPRFIIKYNIMSIFTAFVILFIYFIYKHINIIRDKKEDNNKKKYAFTNIYFFIVLFIISLFIFFLQYYSNIPAEQLAFHLQTPLEGTSFSVVLNFLFKTLLPTIIIVLLMYLQIKIFQKKKIKFVFNYKNRKWAVLPILYYKKRIKIIVLSILILLSIYTIYNYDILSFISNQFLESNFIEEEYVDPNTVELTFPEEKRNLIYIYLESMETTFSDYTPYLNNIASSNITFGNKFYEIVGANWTIASMVAQTSGLPLKFSVDSSSYNVDNNSFLNGIVTLGDILKDNDYNNYLYIGSNAAFAGRDLFFTIHGEYEIFDYNTAVEEGYIEDDYFVWWGYEDKKLYEYSKEKLLELASEEEPFNFTLLTVDTHYTDGYLDETCDSTYSYQYANVISCADSMIGEFIDWIQNQDFYENTTIVIVGDHLYMESSLFINSLNTSERYIYNTIINSAIDIENNIDREFTALDLFPTTLAALGVEIDGNRLGLGVNLFSNEKTIIEKYGYDYVNNELKKKSTFYQRISLYSE